MDPLTLEQIATFCGGMLLQGNPATTTSRISKDTRTLAPGDLYFTLHGENHDGNRFAIDAAKKGAIAAVLDDPSVAKSLPGTFGIILVADPLKALQQLATAWRTELNLKALCITGSSGKTSTKDFAAAVLGNHFRTTCTLGNLNNHIGLPISILNASSTDEAAVWEIGMNHPGEIAPLAAMAHPDAAAITGIGVAHIEFMKNREAIALEKGRLAESVSSKGLVILNADDDMSDALASRCSARVLRVGTTGGDIQAGEIQMDSDGSSFLVTTPSGSQRARISVHGEHMVRNALFAIAAGMEFGMPLEECCEGLASASLTGGRLQQRTIRGITIIDDTYNANPDSMEAALNTLRQLPVSGRRIAALGRMGELGEYAETGYRRVGKVAAQSLDVLVIVGQEATLVGDTARAGGLREIHTALNQQEAADILRKIAGNGDTVLIKGSRGAHMEEVIKGLEN